MIAARIGPDLRMDAVGSPADLKARRKPRTPRDLTDHARINIRLASYGGHPAWEFEKGGQEVRVRVEGPLAFSRIDLDRKIWCWPTSPRAGSSASSRIGARRSRAII